MSPKVSIIVLNWNGKHFLKSCIDSLLNQSYQDFEIVIMDNNSSDGSREFVKKTFPRQIKSKKMVVFNTGKNLGFAGGNNAGMRRTNGELIVLLNNDTRVKKHWLKELFKAFNTLMADGRPVLLAGSQSLPTGYVKKMLRGLKNNNGISMSLSGQNIIRKQTKYERKNNAAEQFFAGGASVMFEKKEFPNPFDKDYFSYAEDVYLGWRAQLRGGGVVLATKSHFYHYAAGAKKSGKKINAFVVYHGMKNTIINHFIFYEWLNVLRALPYLLLVQLVQIVQNPRRVIPLTKAWWWIFTHPRKITQKRKAMQRTRKIPDRDILMRMSYKLMDPKSRFVQRPIQRTMIEVLNTFLFYYCLLVFIRTREFQ